MSNLADVRGKKITVVLSDGIERELRFTLNSMAEIEDKYESAEAIFEALDKKRSFKALRTLLWAGLIHEDAKLTETQVGGLINMANVEELMVQVVTAVNGDMPSQDEPAAPLQAAGIHPPNV